MEIYCLKIQKNVQNISLADKLYNFKKLLINQQVVILLVFSICRANFPRKPYQGSIHIYDPTAGEATVSGV